MWPRGIPRRFRRVSERFVVGNSVRLLNDGAEAFPAISEAIEGAREQILLEMYWFDSGRVGRGVAQALANAARRGVEVAVIYDSLGSWDAATEMFMEMAEAGVHLLEFNPLAPWKQRFRLGRLTRRDHRKILVVDGRIGFTGGINFSDKWLPVDQGGEAWRDEMVRVEGPAVRGFLDCFHEVWERERGVPLDRSRVRVEARDTRGAHAVRVLGENFARNRRQIVAAYLANIYAARKRVWIKNSYFVPDLMVTRALKRAAGSGVDVRVMLPAHSDVEIVRYASRAMWSSLMRAGVRIFEWQPTILHSKSAVIDGHWSTVGTFNLDYLSLRSNLEVNVSVRDEAFGALMEARFVKDLEQCTEVDSHNFRFRPLCERLLEVFLYNFRKLL
jgi:cardiolipin synthase